MTIWDLKLFLKLTIIFNLLIFFTNFFIFGKSIIEEDKTKVEKIEEITEKTNINFEDIKILEEKEIEKIKKYQEEKIKEEEIELKSPSKKYNLLFFPWYYQETINKDKLEIFNSFLASETISKFISNIDMKIYEEKKDIRWKMKEKTIYMFWCKDQEKEEILSVFIHEFWHYIDLYFLEKKLIKDISDDFYNISWEKTKVIKAWFSEKDFVSGYAMTNKYEDFAETFIYFVLHNKDFLEKTKKSEVLEEKYNFLISYIFRSGEFQNSDFSENNKVKDYYWDTTKIKVNSKKFLDYLKSLI